MIARAVGEGGDLGDIASFLSSSADCAGPRRTYYEIACRAFLHPNTRAGVPLSWGTGGTPVCKSNHVPAFKRRRGRVGREPDAGVATSGFRPPPIAITARANRHPPRARTRDPREGGDARAGPGILATLVSVVLSWRCRRMVPGAALHCFTHGPLLYRRSGASLNSRALQINDRPAARAADAIGTGSGVEPLPSAFMGLAAPGCLAASMIEADPMIACPSPLLYVPTCGVSDGDVLDGISNVIDDDRRALDDEQREKRRDDGPHPFTTQGTVKRGPKAGAARPRPFRISGTRKSVVAVTGEAVRPTQCPLCPDSDQD